MSEQQPITQEEFTKAVAEQTEKIVNAIGWAKAEDRLASIEKRFAILDSHLVRMATKTYELTSALDAALTNSARARYRWNPCNTAVSCA